jgi:hypothetical protein
VSEEQQGQPAAAVQGAAQQAQERPELLVAAALAGGFVLAKVLKRIVN